MSPQQGIDPDGLILVEAMEFARAVFTRLGAAHDTDASVSALTRHRLAEYLALVTKPTGPSLPLRADGSDAAASYHDGLRQHIAREYVGIESNTTPCTPAVAAVCGFRCFNRTATDWRISELASCARAVVETNRQWVRCSAGGVDGWNHYCDVVKQRNSSEIQEHLCSTSYPRTPSGWGLAVLQRWNSFTPALAASEGGGYFAFEGEPSGSKEDSGLPVKTGVVVDPGYGFVKNFLSERFGIPDVTAVVVTHDHPDHLADFQAIVNLLLELKKNRGGKGAERRPIDALLSSDSYEHLLPIVDGTSEVFRDTVVLSPDGRLSQRTSAETRGFSVEAHLALHDNGSFHLGGDGTDSIGVTLRPLASPFTFELGFPSDTEYRDDVAAEYANSDVLCLHLGGFTPDPGAQGSFVLADYFLDTKTDWHVLAKKSHLYLPGVLWFLSDFCGQAAASGRRRLVVLSEFGEELSRGLRLLISRAFDDHAKRLSGNTVRVIPGDVGLLIDPVDCSVRCSTCDQFYPWDTEFDYEVYGPAEQIFYVCPTCSGTLSAFQKAEIFRRQLMPSATLVGPR